MENDKKIDIKISTDQFEIKNLEIVNGRIELVLSASITQSSINESSLPAGFPANTPLKAVAAPESIQTDSLDVPRIMEVKSDDYQHDDSAESIADSSPVTESEIPVYEVPEDLPVYNEVESYHTTAENDSQTVHDKAVSTAPPQDVEEKQRYGEPESDVEWQAVEVEDQLTLNENPAPPVLPVQEEIKEEVTDIQEEDMLDDELPEYLHEEPVEEAAEPTEEVENNSITSSPAIPLATPDKNQELPGYLHPQQNTSQQASESIQKSDSLPDYLQKSMPTENHKQTFPSYIKEHGSENASADAATTQPEIPAEMPAPQPEQETKVNTEPKPQPAPAPEVNQPELPEEQPAPATIKKVRFVCPKCKTPGSLPIDKIGSIISCSNCGRAMKLNIKK